MCTTAHAFCFQYTILLCNYHIFDVFYLLAIVANYTVLYLLISQLFPHDIPFYVPLLNQYKVSI